MPVGNPPDSRVWAPLATLSRSQPAPKTASTPVLQSGAVPAGEVWGEKGAFEFPVLAKAVLIRIVCSGVASFIAYKGVDLTNGRRVSEEGEREGLDTTSHGETAYNR